MPFKKFNMPFKNGKSQGTELLGKPTCLICKKTVSEKPYSAKSLKKFEMWACEFVKPSKREALGLKIHCMVGVHTVDEL